MLQYVNPMVINCWALAARFSKLKFVGLCHSVQGTAAELAHDLDLPIERIRYRAAGINHMAFYLNFEEQLSDGSYQDLYPLLRQGFLEDRLPKPSTWNDCCQNLVRYEMLMRLGYFVTESSEHFAEYTPWFIKSHRPDLIDTYKVPLDEYPIRCVEQIAGWKSEMKRLVAEGMSKVPASHEYASQIMNSIVTGDPAVIYGNVPNHGAISSLPDSCVVEVPCLVDRNGIQPTKIGALPPQLTAVIRTNLNVQELTVEALLTSRVEHVYHAMMMDPHTGAELDLDQIHALADELMKAHRDWLPNWVKPLDHHTRRKAVQKLAS